MSNNTFDLDKFKLTPEQMAELAPFQKKSKPKVQALRTPRAQRTAAARFVQLPYAPAAAGRLRNPQLAVLIEVGYLAFKAHGKPTPLSNKALRFAGVRHEVKTRALRQLEKAGWVTVTWRGRGKSPLVSLRWE